MGGFPRVGDDKEREEMQRAFDGVPGMVEEQARTGTQSNTSDLGTLVRERYNTQDFKEIFADFVSYGGLHRTPKDTRAFTDYVLKNANLYEQLKSGADSPKAR